MSQRTPTSTKRFDAFMEAPIINPWNQSLCILNETIEIEQSQTGAAFVCYSGECAEILALLHALCGCYRGYYQKPGRWYFHAQLQPSVRIAMLAMQDKAGHLIVEDIRCALGDPEIEGQQDLSQAPPDCPRCSAR